MKFRKIVYLVIIVLSFLIFPGKSGLVKEAYACTPGPYCVSEPITCGACSPSCGPGTQTCSDCCSSWGQACNNGPCCSNSSPDTPVPSTPSNGSMVTSLSGNQVSWSAIASWGTNCAGNNNTYTVYLDTNANPSTELCSVSSATTSCATGTLADSALYYWKVVASNGALSSTSSIWNFYSPYSVFGWIYKETDNSITRATEASEGLLPNYIVNLTIGKTGSYTSAGSAVGGYVGNYYFQELLNNSIYRIELQVTPTRSVLYPDGLHTNPYYVQSMTQSQYVDFPFITITPQPTIPDLGFPTSTPTPVLAPPPTDPPTPTPLLPTITPGGPTLTPTPTITPGGPTLTPTATPTITPGGPTLTPTPTITPGGPTLTPTPTITPGGPTLTPTPTITPGGPSLTPTPTITPGGPTLTPTATPTITPGGPTLTPTPTITPGGPTLSPTPTLVPGCSYLPTPNIQGPNDQSCTNIKPNFSAIVSNPNNDSVWARFYTNYFETFSRMGSVQPNTGGTSVWMPDGSVLNFTGGYWWSAYTESPSCPRSGDAQARLLNMDYSAPPFPAKPVCTLVEQDISTGNCNFTCSWSTVSENDASCSDTNNYHPIYWNTPGPGNWDAGWIGNLTSQTVYDIPSGQNLNMQIVARDGLGNTSSVSESVGPFACPTVAPSSTPMPTPTSILPTPPASCAALPTPMLESPGHETCTNTRPTFSAVVSNPNKDSVWARFNSNFHEKFNQMGSVVAPEGGSSKWTPQDSKNLYINGDYWWSAYTESPTCPKSADAPASLLRMDYSPPPQPKSPSCILKSQDVAYSGTCTFLCSWEANLENDGTCANTNEYWPSYTNSPGPGGWGAHKIMTPVLSEEVQNVPDGQSIISKMYTKDGAGNISEVSTDSGPYSCPKIITGPTITPGGPTLVPSSSPTPSITPSPTITPTPSPGVWLQLVGGDIYQKSVKQDALPVGQTFLAPISSPNNPGSSGIVLWKDAVSINGGTSSISSNNWNVKLDQGLTNQYSFQYYWEALKNKAANLPNKSVVGDPVDLTGIDSIYYYGTSGYTQLSQSFTQPSAPKTPVTIFLISGSLEITKNFSIASNQSVIFVVSGNILIDGSVTNIPGLYISSGIFSVAAGSDPIVINGMVYAKNINLNREYRSYTTPTYQFVYQPKYFIALLPYLGRQQVNWQEIKP